MPGAKRIYCVNMVNKKFLILTSIVVNKYNLKDTIKIFSDCDYIAFTDISYDTKCWTIHPYLPFTQIDSAFAARRNAKVYKILSCLMFPQYEYIVWTDGNHQIKVHPQEIINKYGDADFYTFKHPERNCSYKEMDIVEYLGYDTKNLIHAQRKYYTEDKFPANFGLCELPTFIKKNSNQIKQLELMWWEQICKFSSRDQYSLPYCLWKLKISDVKLTIKMLKGTANAHNGGNVYFDEQSHLFNHPIKH